MKAQLYSNEKKASSREPEPKTEVVDFATVPDVGLTSDYCMQTKWVSDIYLAAQIFLMAAKSWKLRTATTGCQSSRNDCTRQRAENPTGEVVYCLQWVHHQNVQLATWYVLRMLGQCASFSSFDETSAERNFGNKCAFNILRLKQIFYRLCD